MVNGVSGAKLPIDQNSCELSDLEIVEKGFAEISTVGEDGYPQEHKESDAVEAYTAYYYCNNCGTDWTVTSLQTQEQAWQLAKEHLNG